MFMCQKLNLFALLAYYFLLLLLDNLADDKKNLTFSLLMHPCFKKESLIGLNNNFRCSLNTKDTQKAAPNWKEGEKKPGKLFF